jgi:hypothetical protein
MDGPWAMLSEVKKLQGENILLTINFELKNGLKTYATSKWLVCPASPQ